MDDALEEKGEGGDGIVQLVMEEKEKDDDDDHDALLVESTIPLSIYMYATLLLFFAVMQCNQQIIIFNKLYV